MRWEHEVTYEDDTHHPTPAPPPNGEDTWELVSAVKSSGHPYNWVYFWKRPRQDSVEEARPNRMGQSVTPEEHNSGRRTACLEELVIGQEYCTLEEGHPGPHVFQSGDDPE